MTDYKPLTKDQLDYCRANGIGIRTMQRMLARKPQGKWLTREEVETAIAWPADIAAMKGVLDHLFGEEP